MNRTIINSAHAHQTFEDIKHIDEQGNEFWYARSLAKVLDYSDYRNFVAVIEKAMTALEQSNMQVPDHIGEVTEMVGLDAKGIHAHKGLKKSQKIRQTIQELGGTMPEELPTPDKSIVKVEREQQKTIAATLEKEDEA